MLGVTTRGGWGSIGYSFTQRTSLMRLDGLKVRCVVTGIYTGSALPISYDCKQSEGLEPSSLPSKNK